MVENLVLEDILLQNFIVLSGFGAIFLLIILAHRSARKDLLKRQEARAVPVPGRSERRKPRDVS